MAGVVTECTSQSAFDQALQQAGTSQLVVVDFTASWCGPCKMIKPHFEALAKQYTNVKFLKVDVDTNRATSQAYGVSAMPTFLFIKNKSVLETIRGADKNKLTSAVEKHSKGSTGSSSAFSGKGNTLSGGSRYNPLGDDDEDDDDGSTAREEGEAREGDIDPQVKAFLESQQASQPQDIESMRLREERIKAGGMRNVKSRYQREKEEAQRKKEVAEREAAAAYDDFVRAMDGGGGSGSSPSTQAGRAGSGFVSAGGSSSYNPARQAPPPTAPKAMRAPPPAAAPSSTSALGGMFGNDDDDEEEDLIAKREPPGKRKRGVDDFVGELQKQQAQREERYKDRIAEGTSVSSILALQGQKMGSRDVGDPQTTNVCVLNLPANISEKTLGEFFSQWGDIATVKIMWPRSDESMGGMGAMRNTRSAGLTGFVCFMKRRDAESAFREADGVSWGGVLLKTSWGKAMPKPARALYVMSTASRRERDAQDEPFNRGRSTSPPPRRIHRPSRQVNEHRHQRSPSPRTQVRQSLSSEQAETVTTVAQRIKAYGPSFEQMVREKEAGNDKFAFLDTDSQSNEAHYFRSLMDERYVPTLPDAPFTDDGYASLYSSDSGEDSETDRLKSHRKTDTLGRLARKRFSSMLRSLTLRRERIMRCTSFAIEHANASESIAEILTQSLLQPSTPIPRKLARLYVISDILHNSAVPLPNAWKYRSAFESHGRVVIIFQHFAQIAKSFPGLMKQESVRGYLRAILDVWDDWMVFSPGLVEQLRGVVESGGRVEGVHAVQEVINAPAVDDIDGEDIDGEDIDGEDML